MGLTACRCSSCRSGRFLCTLLEGGQLNKRIRWSQRKISPGQRQGFVNPGAGIPERRQQHLAMKIRHIVEQGTHFRRQQVFRQLILYERHLSQGQCRRIVDSDRQLRWDHTRVYAGNGRNRYRHCAFSVPVKRSSQATAATA